MLAMSAVHNSFKKFILCYTKRQGRLISRRCVSEDRSASGKRNHTPVEAADPQDGRHSARYRNVVRSQSMFDAFSPLDWSEVAKWRATCEREQLESRCPASANNTRPLVSCNRVHPALRQFVPQDVPDEEVLNISVTIPDNTSQRNPQRGLIDGTQKGGRLASTINRQERSSRHRINLANTPAANGSLHKRQPSATAFPPFIKKDVKEKQYGLNSHRSSNFHHPPRNSDNDKSAQRSSSQQQLASVLDSMESATFQNKEHNARKLSVEPGQINDVQQTNKPPMLDLAELINLSQLKHENCKLYLGAQMPSNSFDSPVREQNNDYDSSQYVQCTNSMQSVLLGSRGSNLDGHDQQTSFQDNPLGITNLQEITNFGNSKVAQIFPSITLSKLDLVLSSKCQDEATKAFGIRDQNVLQHLRSDNLENRGKTNTCQQMCSPKSSLLNSAKNENMAKQRKKNKVETPNERMKARECIDASLETSMFKTFTLHLKDSKKPEKPIRKMTNKVSLTATHSKEEALIDAAQQKGYKQTTPVEQRRSFQLLSPEKSSFISDMNPENDSYYPQQIQFYPQVSYQRLEGIRRNTHQKSNNNEEVTYLPNMIEKCADKPTLQISPAPDVCSQSLEQPMYFKTMNITKNQEEQNVQVDMIDSIAKSHLVKQTKLYNLQWLNDSKGKTCLDKNKQLSDDEEEFHDCISVNDSTKPLDVPCGNTEFHTNEPRSLDTEMQNQNVERSKSLSVVSETSLLPLLGHTMSQNKFANAMAILKTVSCPFFNLDKKKDAARKGKSSVNNDRLVTLWEKVRVTDMSPRKERKFNVLQPSTWFKCFMKTDIPPISDKTCTVIHNVNIPSSDDFNHHTRDVYVTGPLVESYKQATREIDKIFNYTKIPLPVQHTEIELETDNTLTDNVTTMILQDQENRDPSTDLSESLEQFNSCGKLETFYDSNSLNVIETGQTVTCTDLESIFDQQDHMPTSETNDSVLPETHDPDDVFPVAPKPVSANCKSEKYDYAPYPRLQPNSSKFLEGLYHDNQHFKIEHKQNFSTSATAMNASVNVNNVAGQVQGTEEHSTNEEPCSERTSNTSECTNNGSNPCQPHRFPPPILQRDYKIPLRIVYADLRTEAIRHENVEAIALPPEKLTGNINSPRLNSTSLGTIRQLKDRLNTWGQTKEHTDQRHKKSTVAKESESHSNNATHYSQRRQFSTKKRPFQLENIPNTPNKLCYDIPTMKQKHLTESVTQYIRAHGTQSKSICQQGIDLTESERSELVPLQVSRTDLATKNHDGTQSGHRMIFNSQLMAYQKVESVNNNSLTGTHSQFAIPKVAPTTYKTQVNNATADHDDTARRIYIERTPSDQEDQEQSTSLTDRSDEHHNITEQDVNESLLGNTSLSSTKTARFDKRVSIYKYASKMIDPLEVKIKRPDVIYSPSNQIIYELITNKKEVKKIKRPPPPVIDEVPEEVDPSIEIPRQRATSIIENINKNASRTEFLNELALKQQRYSASIIEKLLTPADPNPEAYKRPNQRAKSVLRLETIELAKSEQRRSASRNNVILTGQQRHFSTANFYRDSKITENGIFSKTTTESRRYINTHLADTEAKASKSRVDESNMTLSKIKEFKEVQKIIENGIFPNTTTESRRYINTHLADTEAKTSKSRVDERNMTLSKIKEFKEVQKIIENSIFPKTTTESRRSINTHPADTETKTSKSRVGELAQRNNIQSSKIKKCQNFQRPQHSLKTESKMARHLDISRSQHVNRSSVDLIAELMNKINVTKIPVDKERPWPQILEPEETQTRYSTFIPNNTSQLSSKIENIVSSSKHKYLRNSTRIYKRSVSMEKLIGLPKPKLVDAQYMTWNIPKRMIDVIETKNDQLDEIKSHIPYQVGHDLEGEAKHKSGEDSSVADNSASSIHQQCETTVQRRTKQRIYPSRVAFNNVVPQPLFNAPVRLYSTRPARLTESPTRTQLKPSSVGLTNTVAKQAHWNVLHVPEIKNKQDLNKNANKFAAKPKPSANIKPQHEFTKTLQAGKSTTIPAAKTKSSSNMKRQQVFTNKLPAGKSTTISAAKTKSSTNIKRQVVHKLQGDKSTTKSAAKTKSSANIKRQQVFTNKLPAGKSTTTSAAKTKSMANIKSQTRLSNKLSADKSTTISTVKTTPYENIKAQQALTDKLPVDKRTISKTLTAKTKSIEKIKPQQALTDKLPVGKRTISKTLAAKTKSIENIKAQQALTDKLPVDKRTISKTLTAKTKSIENIKPQQALTDKLPVDKRTISKTLAAKTKSIENIKPQQTLTDKLPVDKRTISKTLAAKTKSIENIKPQQALSDTLSAEKSTISAVKTKPPANVKSQQVTIETLPPVKSKQNLTFKPKSLINIKSGETLTKILSSKNKTTSGHRSKSLGDVEPYVSIQKLPSGKITTKLVIKTESSVNGKQHEVDINKFQPDKSKKTHMNRTKSLENVKRQKENKNLNAPEEQSKMFALKTKASGKVGQQQVFKKTSLENNASPKLIVNKFAIVKKRSSEKIKSSVSKLLKHTGKGTATKKTKLAQSQKPGEVGSNQTTFGNEADVKQTLAQGNSLKSKSEKKTDLSFDKLKKSVDDKQTEVPIEILKKTPLIPKIESLASEFYSKAQEIKSQMHSPKTTQKKSEPSLSTKTQRKELNLSMFPQLQSVPDTRKVEVVPQVKANQLISKAGNESLEMIDKDTEKNVFSPNLENVAIDNTDITIKPQSIQAETEPEIQVSATKPTSNAESSESIEVDLLAEQLSAINTKYNLDVKDTEPDSSASKDQMSKINEGNTPLPEPQMSQNKRTNQKLDSGVKSLKDLNIQNTSSICSETNSLGETPSITDKLQEPCPEIKANTLAKTSKQIKEKPHGLQPTTKMGKLSLTQMRRPGSSKESGKKINNLISAAAYKPWRTSETGITPETSKNMCFRGLKKKSKNNETNAVTAPNVIYLPPPKKDISKMNSTGKPLYRVKKPLVRYYSYLATNSTSLESENETKLTDSNRKSDESCLRELLLPAKKRKPPSFMSVDIDDSEKSPRSENELQNQHWKPPRMDKPPPKLLSPPVPPEQMKTPPPVNNASLRSSQQIKNSYRMSKRPNHSPNKLHVDVPPVIKIGPNLKGKRINPPLFMARKAATSNKVVPRSANCKLSVKPKVCTQRISCKNKKPSAQQMSNGKSQVLTQHSSKRKQLQCSSEYGSDGYTTASWSGSKLMAVLPSVQSRVSHSTSSNQRPPPNYSMGTGPVAKLVGKRSRMQVQQNKQQSTTSFTMSTPDCIMSNLYSLNACASKKRVSQSPSTITQTIGEKPLYFHSKTRYRLYGYQSSSTKNPPCEDEKKPCDTARQMRKVFRKPPRNDCRMKKVCTVWPQDYCRSKHKIPEREIIPLDCAKLRVIKPIKSCALMKLPGCKNRLRMDCTRELPDDVCIKIMPPMPSFSECVRKLPSKPAPTECRISEKIKYLQPQNPFFVNRKDFKILPPNPGARIDPSLAECCVTKPSSTHHCDRGCGSSGQESECNTQAPVSLLPPLSLAPPPCVPNRGSSGPGSDELLSFLQSWFPFLKYQSPLPSPTKGLGSHASGACEFKPAPKLAASSSTTTCRATVTKKPRVDRVTMTQREQKIPQCLFNDKKIRFPGCNIGKVYNCNEPPPKPRVPCTKLEPPVPSFSECNKRDFPPIPVSECLVAEQLTYIHKNLREKRKRITREAIEYTKCKAKKQNPDDNKSNCGGYSMSSRESMGVRLEGQRPSAIRLYHQNTNERVARRKQPPLNSHDIQMDGNISENALHIANDNSPTCVRSNGTAGSSDYTVVVANMSRPLADIVKSVKRSFTKNYEKRVSDHNMDAKTGSPVWSSTREFTSVSKAQSLQHLNELDTKTARPVSNKCTRPNKAISLAQNIQRVDEMTFADTGEVIRELDLIPETSNRVPVEDGNVNRNVDLMNKHGDTARMLDKDSRRVESIDNINPKKAIEHGTEQVTSPKNMAVDESRELNALNEVYVATMNYPLKSLDKQLRINTTQDGTESIHESPENTNVSECAVEPVECSPSYDRAQNELSSNVTPTSPSTVNDEKFVNNLEDTMDKAPNKIFSSIKKNYKLFSGVGNTPDTTHRRFYSKKVSNDECEVQPTCKPLEREVPCREKTKEEIRCEYDPCDATVRPPGVVPCPIVDDKSCGIVPYKLAPGELEENDCATPTKDCNKPKALEVKKMCDVVKPKPKPKTNCFSKANDNDCKPKKSTTCEPKADQCSLEDIRQKIAKQLKKWFGCADEPAKASHVKDSCKAVPDCSKNKPKVDECKKMAPIKKPEDTCKKEPVKVKKPVTPVKKVKAEDKSSDDLCKALEVYVKKKQAEIEKCKTEVPCKTDKKKNTCKKMKFVCPSFEPLRPPPKNLGNPPCEDDDKKKDCADEKKTKEGEIVKDPCKCLWELKKESLKGLSKKQQIEAEMKSYHDHYRSKYKN